MNRGLTCYMLLSVVLWCVAASSNWEADRSVGGYPHGFLADCKGSEDEISIPENMIKKLSFVVYRSLWDRHAYSYKPGSTAAAIARDRRMRPDRKTVLFISGHLDSPNFIYGPLLGDIYVKLGYNVLLLDTNRFYTYFYATSVRLTRDVGSRVGEVLAQLAHLGYRPRDIELLGLSLGGQAIAFAANTFFELTGEKLGRLTGFDPAGPCFRHRGLDGKLDASDADWVDIIHTNIDGLGDPLPLGHVDFYVNGGEWQPGNIDAAPCLVLCSHIRSLFLWLTSLEAPQGFVALRCDNVQQARDRKCFERSPREINILGPNTNRSAPGIFYLGTTNHFPWYMGKKGLYPKHEVFRYLVDKYYIENNLLE